MHYTGGMAKMIQIRNVPDALHRKLKARAAMEGKSLSEYLREEVAKLADRPTLKELLDRLSKQPSFQPDVPIAEMIRAERDAR